MFESMAIANAVAKAQNPKNEIEDASGFANPNFADDAEAGNGSRAKGTLNPRVTGISQPATSRSINANTDEIVDESQPLMLENDGIGRSPSYTDVARSASDSDEEKRKDVDKLFAIEKKYEMVGRLLLF